MQQFSLDHLTETEFEEFCYDLLCELGCSHISWRKGTGLSSSPSDQGRDIECQFVKEDVDGTTYLETWFVECKHYRRGVPPEKLLSVLAWAKAERPDVWLIIASNFLSNPTKNLLEDFRRNHTPTFRIRYWEKPNLEKLTHDKIDLLRKYKIDNQDSGNFPLAAMLFTQSLTELQRILHTTLLTMGAELPQMEQQSVFSLWEQFASQANISEDYNTTLNGIYRLGIFLAQKYLSIPYPEGIIPPRGNGNISFRSEEMKELIDQLGRVMDFVRDYAISKDILPALKEKYPKWMRPDITAVHIVQKKQAVLLETVIRKSIGTNLADEKVYRLDLGFISNDLIKVPAGEDYPPFFPITRTAQENAERFVNELGPYSIMMCTDLFTKEGGAEVSQLNH